MEKVETKAKLRYFRGSPRRARLIIDLIRGMKADEAVVQLAMMKKQLAKPIMKLLQSAIANAKNNDEAKEDSLVIKTAFVDGGPILYRWRPRAFGRAAPIRHRTIHMTIVLEGESEGKKKDKNKKVKVEKVEEENENKKIKVEEEKNTTKDKKEVKKINKNKD